VDLLTLTGLELQTLLKNRVITSADIVVKYLDQIEKHNRAGLKLNAVISTAREATLELAKKLDAERERGVIRGPLHGIPLLVKVRYISSTNPLSKVAQAERNRMRTPHQVLNSQLPAAPSLLRKEKQRRMPRL